jgi:hypothetical protein
MKKKLSQGKLKIAAELALNE